MTTEFNAAYTLNLKADSGYKGDQAGRCNHAQYAVASGALGDAAYAKIAMHARQLRDALSELLRANAQVSEELYLYEAADPEMEPAYEAANAAMDAAREILAKVEA